MNRKIVEAVEMTNAFCAYQFYNDFISIAHHGSALSSRISTIAVYFSLNFLGYQQRESKNFEGTEGGRIKCVLLKSMEFLFSRIYSNIIKQRKTTTSTIFEYKTHLLLSFHHEVSSMCSSCDIQQLTHRSPTNNFSDECRLIWYLLN